MNYCVRTARRRATRQRPLTSKKNSKRDRGATLAARLLSAYRLRLTMLLEAAESTAPLESGELKLAVGRLVEDLNADLLRLYRLAEDGALSSIERRVAMPTLERLRDTLRHRGARVRPMRDTLHKAINGLVSATAAARSGSGLPSSS